MTPDELAKLVDALITRADKRYAAAIGRIQDDLHSQLVSILKDLELDKDGYIKQTASNRVVLKLSEKKIDEIYKSPGYVTSVSNFVTVIPRIDAANSLYFQTVNEAFNANRVYLRQLQNDAIATIEKFVLQDGLQSQVVSPLKQILVQNVNSGGSFSGFMEQLRSYVLGSDDVEPRALSYTRTYLKDSLFTYSRTYQQSITTDLKLEYYLYSGGVMDKTRAFCMDRTGKFYSHKEIEAWASEEWAGKKQGTTESSIFLFCGGWNCGHQLIPVSDKIVPTEVIERQ